MRKFSVQTQFGFFNLIVDSQAPAFLADERKVVGGVLKLTISEVPEFQIAKSGEFVDELVAWSSGELSALDTIPAIYPETVFRSQVSAAMRRVKAGQSSSYKALANSAGAPAAIRAAGSACARNPVPIIIPCHRIIKSDGSIGEFLYGTYLKRLLLQHEGFQIQ
jgi:O-6-methylguanine DNA methyltransferase